MEKKVILSGIQATGDLTLGNYVGALKNFVKMQDEYNCFYMIANLHALTVRRNPDELKNNTLKILASYIACRNRSRKKYSFFTITSFRTCRIRLGFGLLYIYG